MVRKKDKNQKHLPVTLTCFTQMELHSFIHMSSISCPASAASQVAHEGGEMLDYSQFVTLPLCPSFFLILSPCSGVGPSRRLQSFGMSPLHPGFSAWTADTVRNLLPNGPFTHCSMVISFSVVLSRHWREISALL